MQAHAQTVGTLVSNLGKSSAASSSSQQAQSFTTGTNAAGYGLTGVELDILGERDTGILVRIAPNSSNGQPDLSDSAAVITLSNPATLNENAVNTFSAPTGTLLATNTTYHVVTTSADGTAGSISVARTRSKGEDSDLAAGWSIGNTRYWRSDSGSSWTADNHFVVKIAIKGTIINVPPEFADETATRSFDETVGDAVVSTPTDIGDLVAATDGNNDPLTYTLEGTDATKFTIESSSGQIKTKAGESYSHEAAASYAVTVKADDGNGGTDTIEVTLQVNDVAEPPPAPAAPTVTPAESTTDSLRVQWPVPDNAGRPTIVSYDLQYRQGSSGAFTDGPQNVSATNAVIADLSADTSYQVQVRATNDEGDGPWSSSGTGSTLAVIPTASIAGGSATEGSAVTFTVTLSSATTADVSVPYSTSVTGSDTATLNATAPGGADFTAATNATLNIVAGSLTGTISVPTTNDTVDEPDETFTVTLGTPTNATLGSPAAATGTINDNDATPQVTLVLTPDSISENGGSSNVTATLDRASSEATTITVSTAPVTPAVAGDFSQSGSTLTIAAGATTSTGTVTIAANDNALSQGNKSVTVSATATNTLGVTAPANKTLEITDDDQASTTVTLSVDPASISEGATGNARTVTVTATLDGAALAADVVVAVSVAGDTATAVTDFAAVSDFDVTITGGQTSGFATFTLEPVDDDIDETGETVTVTGSTTSSGLTVAPAGGVTVTIDDDDDAPTVTLALSPTSISEDGGQTTVTATLDHPSSEETTVTVSTAPVAPAVAGDYTQNGTTLTIAAGQTTSTGTVTITANNNNIHTGDKSATVSGTANNTQGIVLPSAQTLTIEEDDTESTTVTLSVDRDTISEGATGNAQTVTVTAELDHAARPQATSVTVSVGAATATEGTDFVQVTDFTITIPEGATSAIGTFDLVPIDDSVDEPGETVLVTGTTTASGLTVAPAAGLPVTISDNDPMPVVTLVLTPASISEDGGQTTVTATLDRPSSEETTVTVAAAAGSNTANADFALSANTTLTIAAGEKNSTGTVTIAAVDNSTSGANKSVTVSATVSNDLGADAPADKTLTITDDEVASTGLTLSVDRDIVSEGATGSAQVVTVTATLDGAASEQDIFVTVSVTGDTAVANTDFSAVTDFTLTIEAGETSGAAAFSLIPLQDTIDEPDETLKVTGSVMGLTVRPTGGLTVTLADDDATPTVTLVLSPTSISENGGSSTVTATLDLASSEATTVTVSTTPSAPTVAGDFSQSGTTLTVDAGETTSTGSVTITAIDNNIDHPDRTVTVSGAASNTRIVQPATQTLTITDDEATSTLVTLTVAPPSITEGASGNAQVVTVTGRLDAAARETDATVTLSITGGTAVANTDFTPVTDVTLTIDAGETSGTATFTLAPVDDNIDEPDETVRVNGTSGTTGLSVGQPAGGLTVTITDDDATPTVTLVLSPTSISENGGSSTVTATLDLASSEATTVTVSTTPSAPTVAGDFSQSGTTLTVDAGETTSTGSVTITAIDNNIDHPDRTVTVSGAASNTRIVQPATQTLTITDDEATSTLVTLTVAPPSITEGASGNAQVVTVTGRLDAAARETDATVTLSITGGTAVANTDFTPVTDVTLTIDAGETSGTATFTLAPVDDNIDEPDETVRVNGTSGTTGLSVGQPVGGLTVTITDNDDAPTVTLVLSPTSISENGGSSTVTATLDRASSVATTVTVSMEAGPDTDAADFTVTSNKVLTIAAGAMTSSGTVTITGVDNLFDDTAAKSVTVSGSASNTVGIVNPTAVTLGISDDEADSTMVLLTASPDTVSEGATGSARTVTVTAALNGAARSSDVVVTLSVAADTATETTDFVAVSNFAITIASGETSETGTFALAPVNDTIDEPDETVKVSGTTTATGLTVGSATVTIADNDAAPTVTLALSSASISEDGGQTTVTATLDHPSSEGTTVTVSTAPVAPAVAGDYTQNGTTLTIAAGQTTSTGTVAIAANDNNIHTGNKSATVSGTANNTQGIVQPSAQTLTIEEDDTESTTVTLSVDRNTISEGATGNAQTVTVTAELDHAARPQATSVTVSVGADTATEGTDFVQVTDFTIVIGAGETSAMGTFDLVPIDDSVDEPDETVQLTGTTASGLTLAPVDGLTLTLEDDEATPTVTLVLKPPSISEDGGQTAVEATLDHPSSQATTVTVSSTAVPPTVAGDFSRSGATLTIAAGATTSTGSVTITAIDNAIDHPDREVEITAQAANSLAIVQPSPLRLEITDDEETSTTVTLTVTDLTGEDAIDEGSSATVTVTATLDKAAREQDAVVDVTVVGLLSDATGGTATEGTDFSAVSDFVVTIEAGETGATAGFTLTTLEDEVAESVETVRIKGAIASQTQGPGLTVAPQDGLTVEIADNDPDPVVTLVLTPETISENAGVSRVSATLDRPSGDSLVIRISATATAPATASDFSVSGGPIVIGAGQTISSSASDVTITGVDDSTTGNQKTVTVSGAALGGRIVQPGAKTLTITDDDTPSTGVTLTVLPNRVAEDAAAADQTVTVVAALNGASRDTATTITVSVTGVTATAGTHYVAVDDFAVTIPANSVSGRNTFTLEPVDDEVDAPDRTLRVTGTTTASGLTVSPSAGLTVTIVDDDPSPVVTLELSPGAISEDGGVSTVTATLDRPSSGRTTVDVTAAPVAPAVAGDYRLSGNKRLTIAAGQTASTGTVTVTGVDNAVAAADKEVEVSGTATTTGPAVEQPDALTLTITDNDQASTTVTLSVSPDAISEGATGSARTVRVTAALDGAARSTDTTVAMTVASGTAIAGTDFVAVSDFTVTIAAEQRSGNATFTLTPLDDEIDEPDETVLVTGSLSTPGLALEPAGGLTVTIEDNEPEPLVTLVLTPDSIREDGGATTVTATLDSPSTAVTTITVAASPVAPAVEGDFRLIGSQLTIPIGETGSTGSVTIEAVDNEVEAPNKRVTVSATTENVLGVRDPADRTLTITDNEFPSTAVNLSVLPSEIGEGSSQTIEVSAELDGAARTVDTDITITVGPGTAVASDFTPVNGFTLTIPAEQKSGMATFTLVPTNDETDEPDETVRVSGRLSGLRMEPSGGVTVTLVDDDDPPEVTLALTPDSIIENGGVSTVTASLDHPSSAHTTITVTATAQLPAVAGDFRLRGTRLTIPAGQTDSTGSVTITGVNNDVAAPDKRLEVSGAAENTLSVVQPAVAILTVADDDFPSTAVTLTASPDRVPEGRGGRSVTVTAQLNGAPRTVPTEVEVTVSGGTAFAVTDFEAVDPFTVTIAAGATQGTGRFTLTPVADAVDEDDETLILTGSTAGLDVEPGAGVEVTVEDDDTRGVTVSAQILRLSEGHERSYTVVLDSEPTASVTVPISVTRLTGDALVTVAPPTLSFAAADWDQRQTVTVTADPDPDGENGSVTLGHSAQGGGYDSVTEVAVVVHVQDNDTVPGAPQRLSAKPADGQMILRWTPPSNDGGSEVTGYEYRVDGGAWSPVGGGATAAEFTVQNLTNGRTYVFGVRAVNGVGEGAEATVRAFPARPPGAPADPAVTSGDRWVDVTWTAPTDDGGAPVTHFEVDIDRTGGWIRAGRSSSHRVSQLTNGTSYTFRVRAVNAAGGGEPSAAVSATPATVPGAPMALAAMPRDGRVDLSWAAPSSDGGLAISRYEVEVDGSGTWTSTGNTSTTYTVGGLTNGTTYRFRVRAVSDSGPGAASSSIATAPTATARAPDVPRALTATPADSAVTLSWIAPFSDGGAALLRYEVERDGDGTWTSTGNTSATYTAGGLTNGTSYRFRVRAVNSEGAGPATSAASAVPTTTVTSRAAPVLLPAMPSNGSVQLRWDPPSGGGTVVSYEWEVDGDGSWQSTVSTALSHTVGSLSNGTTYSFRVRAVYAGVGPGQPSSPIDATPRSGGSVAPDAPTGLVATPGIGSVQLRWRPPSNGGAAITHYVVRYMAPPDVTPGEPVDDSGIAVTNGPVRMLTVSGLRQGQSYAFTVEAANVSGVSVRSETVTATPRSRPRRLPAPGVPGNLTATPGDGEVTLAWSAPAGSEPVTGYEVQVDAGAWTATGDTATSYTVAGLVNGTSYTFRVRALNVTRASEASGSVTATPAAMPGVPGNLTATPGDGEVTLAWSAPAGSEPVTGYEVQVDAGAWTATGGTATSYTVAGLVNGTSYTFRVRALNVTRASEASGSVTATPAAMPGVPGNLTATPGDGEVTLAWSAPAGSEPVTGYEVQVDAGAWTATGGTATSYTVAGLVNGTSYTFRVRALNVTRASEASGSVTATPAAMPGVPGNLTATPGDGEVTLAWSAPAGSEPVTGYEVQVDAGAWTATGGTATSYTVAGLVNGTSYTFRVRALNVTRASEASGSVTATPAAMPGVPGNLTATPGDGEVTLAWSAPAGSEPVTGYEVQVDAGAWTATGDTATSYTVAGLVNGTSYTFRVRALNVTRASEASGSVTATPAAMPGVPGNLTATPGDGEVTLAWSAPAGSEPVTGYEVQVDAGAWTATGARRHRTRWRGWLTGRRTRSGCGR